MIDTDARARDRSRARQIGLASLAIGVAVAIIARLRPGDDLGAEWPIRWVAMAVWPIRSIHDSDARQRHRQQQ